MRLFNSYKLFFFIIFSFLFFGCPVDDDLEEGRFPLDPVNFESINSEFDDYNSASPYELWSQFPYLFSSNRNSNGNEFDIVNFIVEYYYVQSSNEVHFNVLDYNLFTYDTVLTTINTPSNEFGPYLMYSRDFIYDFIFYASDLSGNLDIYYTKHETYQELWDEPKPLDKINTENNEAYPTFNRENDEMYFCSDAEGVYDINKVVLSSTSVSNWLETEDLPIWISCESLNSSSNDKCPYINGNLMVFTSDREGGFGGYDLYYSIYKDGNWQEPVNFGEEINTEYDEFRPITIFANRYVNDLMFFSSNRPGGLGGFDLYYVGIPKMIL